MGREPTTKLDGRLSKEVRGLLAGSITTAFSMHISWVYELKLSRSQRCRDIEGKVLTLAQASWRWCKERGTTCGRVWYMVMQLGYLLMRALCLSYCFSEPG